MLLRPSQRLLMPCIAICPFHATLWTPAAFHLPAHIHRSTQSARPLLPHRNMDNRRVMKGNTLYLPVQVAGAFLSMGDAHLAQASRQLEFARLGVLTLLTRPST